MYITRIRRKVDLAYYKLTPAGKSLWEAEIFNLPRPHIFRKQRRHRGRKFGESFL